MGKQRDKRGTAGAAAPVPSIALPPVPLWRVAALPTLAAAALVASVWFYNRPAEEPKGFAEPRAGGVLLGSWEPVTEDDRLVDAFRKAHNADPKTTLNLAPAPVIDGKPVSEEEWEALQADYILRRVHRVGRVRSGEPGKGTAWLNTPGRYTLRTSAGVATPKVPIRSGDRIELPSYLLITDPDIIVEVRGGKIHALRAESRRS